MTPDPDIAAINAVARLHPRGQRFTIPATPANGLSRAVHGCLTHPDPCRHCGCVAGHTDAHGHWCVGCGNTFPS